MSERLPLRPLHSLSALSVAKLGMFDRMASDDLKQSLAVGQERCLKARPDGTMLDGHHRVHVLRMRGEDVDALGREILIVEE